MPTPQWLLMTLSSVHILLAHYTSCSHQPVSSSLPCSEPHALSWGAHVAGSPLEASGWKGGVKGVSRGFCPPLPTRCALGQWLLLSAWSHSYGSDPSFQLPSSLGFGHNVTSVPSASCSCLVLGTSGSFCLPCTHIYLSSAAGWHTFVPHLLHCLKDFTFFSMTIPRFILEGPRKRLLLSNVFHHTTW